MVISRSTGSRADGMRTRFNTYLNDFATKVTLNRVTDVLDSQNRITSSSIVTSTIKADIQYVTKNDLSHLNIGDVDIGDGMLFVKHNVTIQLEDSVVFNDVKWRVTSQIEGDLVGGEIVYKGFIIKKNA